MKFQSYLLVFFEHILQNAMEMYIKKNLMILLHIAHDEKQRINYVTEFPRKIMFNILFNILIYQLPSLRLLLRFQFYASYSFQIHKFETVYGLAISYG